MVYCKCSVKHCPSRKSKLKLSGDILSQRSYHRFPKHAERRAAWIAFTGHGPEWQPHTASFVCSDHFRHEDFQRQHSDDRCRLKETAVPTRRPKADKYVELLKKKASSQNSNESGTGDILEKSLSMVFPPAPQFADAGIAFEEPADDIFTFEVLKSSLSDLNPPLEWKTFTDNSFIMFFRIDELSAEMMHAVTVSSDLVPKIRVRNRLYTGNQFGQSPLQDLGSLRGLLYAVNGATVCSGCEANRSCMLIHKGPGRLCPPCQTRKRMDDLSITPLYPRTDVSMGLPISDVFQTGIVENSCVTAPLGEEAQQEVEEPELDQPISPASATSDPVGPKKRRKGKKLAESDRRLLRATDELKPYQSPIRKMITIWKKISQRVSASGTNRSAKYCRDRMCFLLKQYRAGKNMKGPAEEKQLLQRIHVADEEGSRMTDTQKERSTHGQSLIDKLRRGTLQVLPEAARGRRGQSLGDEWEDDSSEMDVVPVGGNFGTFDANVLTRQLNTEERMKRKRNKDKHRCNVCGSELLTITYLADHIRTAHPEHAGEWTHECLLCDKKFPSQVSLTNHNRNKHKSTPFTVIPTDTEAAIEHMKSTQTFSYYCRTCHRHYPTKPLFDLHQFQHSPADATSNHPERDCSACDFHAPTFADLVAHVSEHSLGRSDPKPCLLCGKFSTILKSHLRSHHPDEMRRIEADWEDQCEECGEKFRSHQSLACHRKKMHDDMQCLYCAKICYVPAEFAEHVEEHKVDEAYPCTLCDKTYPAYSQINKHFGGYHDANHPKFCPICRCIIPGQQHLSKHMSLCDGQSRSKRENVKLADKWRDVPKGQRLPCDDCGKLYSSLESMRSHIHRIHIGEWKESVEKRRKRLIERRRLGLIKKYKRKKKRRLAEFPFRCMECRSGFLTEDRLDRHNERMHEGRDTKD